MLVQDQVRTSPHPETHAQLALSTRGVDMLLNQPVCIHPANPSRCSQAQDQVRTAQLYAIRQIGEQIDELQQAVCTERAATVVPGRYMACPAPYPLPILFPYMQ